MTRAELVAVRDAMIAADQAARARANTERTQEAHEASRASSAALSAWIMANDPPRRASYCCRAGKRQAAERRALTRGGR